MSNYDWQLDDPDEGDDYPHGPRTPHDHRRQWLECPECGYVWSMDALCNTPADQRCSGCVQRANGTGPHVTDPGPIYYYKGADPFGKER